MRSPRRSRRTADRDSPVRDLSSRGWIVAKGLLFLLIAASTGALIWIDRPTLRVAALVALLAWSSARFYYFLFYVLEKYVDPRLRYAGILALLRTIVGRRI